MHFHNCPLHGKEECIMSSTDKHFCTSLESWDKNTLPDSWYEKSILETNKEQQKL